MSSTMQPPSSQFIQSTAAHSYAMDMMRAIAPAMKSFAACLSQGSTSTDKFTINDQLIRLQISLAEAKQQIQHHIPAEMLQVGRAYTFLTTPSQQEMGEWIKGAYDLISSMYATIRSTMYDVTADTKSLRDSIIGEDTQEAGPLPRLMRELLRSSEFTQLNLASPSDRARLGIEVDFASPALRRFVPEFAGS